MAKQRHIDMSNTAMPKSGRQAGTVAKSGLGKAGRSGTPAVPSGEVSRQKGAGRLPDLDKSPLTSYERGVNPLPRPSRQLRRERLPREGLSLDDTAMPRVGHMSATAPGALAYPGSERNSATLDARSSVPVSIQHGPNTRNRFGPLGMYEKGQRADNAQLDDGVGSGRRARGTFRGQRRY